MSASIGKLSVSVGLDLSEMEAGLKKAEREIKNLDKSYKKMGGERGGFGEFGAVRSRASGGFGGGGSGGGFGELSGRLGNKVGGDAIGRFVGGGRIGDMVMNGLGSTGGGLAAGAAGAVGFLSFAIQSAKASKSMDQATLAVLRLGDSAKFLESPMQSLKGLLGDIAVGAVGTAVQVGEFIAAGGSRSDSLKFSAAARGAAQQEANKQKLAEAQGFKSWSEYQAAVKGQRGSNAQFSRDQAFAGTDDQGRARMLGGEIAKLQKEADTAKAERRTLDLEKLRGEIAKKTAEQQTLQKQIDQRALDFENTTRMQAASRMDAADAQQRERTQKGIENDVGDFLRDLDRQREINSMRLGASSLAVSAGASSLGGTAGDGGQAASLQRQQLRTLEQMLKALQDMAETQAFKN